MSDNKTKHCFLTFDVEEWFQVENLKGVIRHSAWEQYTSSVEKNVDRILEILSLFSIKGTFFILGWVAERHPDLVKKINTAGHEIASHGYNHQLTDQLDNKKLQQDILDTKKRLEDYTGTQVLGYRAPSFSVSDRLIDVLQETGYRYDSSYSPFKLNSRYGTIHRSLEKTAGSLFVFNNGLVEVPISIWQRGKLSIPIGGGAYFRLLPFPVFNHLVRSYLSKNDYYAFYLHPWEFEPEQPRVQALRWDYRLRHYTNLDKTEKRLKKFIRFLKNQKCQFMTIRDYIKSHH